MKKVRHSILVALIVILFIGSVAVTGAAAREQKPVEEIKLTAENPVADAQFGRSVAVAGDLVAVGEGGEGAVGAVYLYRHQGMRYIPVTTLISPDAAPDTYPEFGRTVAIQGDTVFVGARFAQAGDLERAGAV